MPEVRATGEDVRSPEESERSKRLESQIRLGKTLGRERESFYGVDALEMQCLSRDRAATDPHAQLIFAGQGW